MKRTLTFILAIALAFGTAMAEKYSINETKLPRTALYFIEKNFGKKAIHHAKADKGVMGIKEYEVILTNGTEIEFDADGALKEIVCSRKKGIPAGIVPTAIADYVKRYFPKTKIVKMEREKRGYEIELSNGAEMLFDNAGNFVRLSD